MISILAISVTTSKLITQENTFQGHGTRSVKIITQEYEKSLNLTIIKEHLKIISKAGSRLTGYPGSTVTASYIEQYFKYLNLTTLIHEYSLYVPIDEGSEIIVLSPSKLSLRAYALWPNGIQTCPSPNLEGRLIYVGKGDLEDFNGKDVYGSIVLMDYYSSDNWLNAAKLGAKAVIFLESENYKGIDRYEALSKFIDIPLNFPRLYVKGKDAYLLRKFAEDNAYVRVVSRMSWKPVIAKNIIGIVNGTKYPNDIIIIAAHYDTWSVVPALANGTLEDTLGIALLLELARYFSKNRPLRTIYFLALSGHWEDIAGAREFVEYFYFSKNVQEGRIKPWLFIELNTLSPSAEKLQLLATGCYIAGGERVSTLSSHYAWLQYKISEYLNNPSLIELIQKITHILPQSLVDVFFTNTMWWGHKQYPYFVDSEAITMSGSLAFAISSSEFMELDFGKPNNVINVPDLKSNLFYAQLYIILALIESFSSEEDWGLSWDSVKPSRLSTERFSFMTLIGKVLTFNITRGWYDPLGNALVRVYREDNAFPLARIVTRADENGTFIIHGIASGLTQGGTYVIEAYIINETNGAIIYAPDDGVYGAQATVRRIRPLLETPPIHGSVVLSKLVPIVLFDVINIKHFTSFLIKDPHPLHRNWVTAGGIILPQHIEEKSDLISYGVAFNCWDPVAIIFVPEDISISVLVRYGGRSIPPSPRPLYFITNSSNSNPEGFGLSVTKEYRVNFTVYYYARDVFLVTKYRYERLKSHNARSISLEKALEEAERNLFLANKYYNERRYDMAYSHALIALSWAYGAYDECMYLINDSASTSFMFFSLCLLSSILLERLFFHKEGKERLLGISTIFIMLLASLYYVHPAISIMANAFMGVLGTILLALFAIVVIILSMRFERIISMITTSILGHHELKRGRFDAAITGMSLAIENMRKRPLRTGLTFATIFFVAMASVALSSVAIYYAPMTASISPTPNRIMSYGILMKSSYGLPGVTGPLQHHIVPFLKGLCKDSFYILPRTVYYPAAVYRQGAIAKVSSLKNETTVRALLGLTPDELKVLYSDAIVLGRGFKEDELFVCMISDSLAQGLNVSVGDTIYFFNMPLRVVGIFASPILERKSWDLDGLKVTPIDPLYIPELSLDAAIPSESGIIYQQLGWSELLVVPYNLVEQLEGYILSIALVPKKNITYSELSEMANTLAMISDIGVYVGWGNSTQAIYRTQQYTALGWNVLTVIMVLSGLNIMTAMLGSIRERRRDIQTFSVLGQTPLGVTIMFFIEILTYVIISATLGYFAGFLFNYLFISMGILPSSFVFNYASTTLAITLSVIIALSCISTTYPALVAGKIVTPSLRRRWKLETRPRGNIWEIPLPFKFTTKREALAMLIFLEEYFRGLGAQTTNFRVIKTSLNLEGVLDLLVDLAPYELGIRQQASIIVIRNEEAKAYNITLMLKLLSGDRSIWESSSRYLIDKVRKQIILWRALGPDIKSKYFEILDKQVNEVVS